LRIFGEGGLKPFFGVRRFLGSQGDFTEVDQSKRIKP
jgi:hypothetical protein